MPPLTELDTNTVHSRRDGRISDSAKSAQLASSIGQKRSRDAVGLSNDFGDSDDDDRDEEFKWNCDQIRAKINALIRSGEMKVTHFQKDLGINSNSYGRFMQYKGALVGADNQTYLAAHRFFRSREARGIKMPKPKKQKPEDVSKFAVSDIHLPGEGNGELPIYDTCDDLRKKIQVHLRNPSVTQASLLREIGKQYFPTRSVQSKQLQDFLHKKGPSAGNTSVVYYGSYLYFEKLRIKNGQAKSKKRQDVERFQPYGMPTSPQHNRRYLCPPDVVPFQDEFGRVECLRIGRR